MDSAPMRLVASYLPIGRLRVAGPTVLNHAASSNSIGTSCIRRRTSREQVQGKLHRYVAHTTPKLKGWG